MGRIRIGTCSFADEALTKWFYPRGLPARERLPYYAERFDTVEIDSTYYHLPEEATTGGWADPFFYAHEGIELAWRVWDTGHRAWYAGDLEAAHPVIDPARHAYYYRLNARNRVWLARRNLPALLVPLYVGSWTAIQVLRWARNPAALGAWFGGWRAGWREHPGERRPMSWRTVWRMTLAGRPPIV